MPDPNTGLTDDELLALSEQQAETVIIEDTLNTIVFDVNSKFDVLWVPRSGNYNVAALFASSNANEFAKVFKQGSAQWLADDAGFSDVLQANWSKDVEGAFGVFSFSLRPRDPKLPQYHEIIRPGDLMFLYAHDNATYATDPMAGTLLTYGIVNRPTRDTASEGGADVETTHISGADLGVIFSKTETVFDQAFAEIENALFNKQWFEKLFSEGNTGSPLEHVLTLLDLIYNTKATGSAVVAAQWQLLTNTQDPTPLASLIDVTSFVQKTMFGYSLPEVFAIAQSGNVWTLLNGYSNKLVNEFFFDVRELNDADTSTLTILEDFAKGVLSDNDVARQQTFVSSLVKNSVFASAAEQAKRQPEGDKLPVMSLVFRQRPYDRDSFNKLPSHIIQGTEVFSDQLGFSDHDVKNFFRIRFPSLPNEFQELIYGVHVNMQSVHRFGLRRMESETRFNFGSSGASTAYAKGDNRPQDFSDIFDWYCGLLATWYAANEELLSGSLTLRFRPEIRCGTRVRYKRRGLVYDLYVQGVNHSFSVEAGASVTTLSLTRGINIDDNSRLANNLFWNPTGSGMPPQLDPYGRFTSAGFTFNSGAVRVINQQKDS